MSSTSTENTNSGIPGGIGNGSTETKSGLALGVGMQGFIGAEYFIFPKMSIGAQYTYRVGVDIQGEGETTVSPASGPSVTTKGGKSTDFGIGSVGIASMNLTLHF